MEYNKINELFEPIFEWLKEHYSNGAYFLVDKNCAKLYSNENITVFSEDIKKYSRTVFDKGLENNSVNSIVKTVTKENKPCLFKLNHDTLGKSVLQV